jgi:magnesium-protoporphyrin IX monomethyl ester (oxidative) cyclase
MNNAAPHLREDLLTPRFYTTDLAKAAQTNLEAQRPAFEALLEEMGNDYNRDHFDRRASLARLAELNPEQKQA